MRLIDADELLTAFPVDDEPTLTKSCVRMTIQHMPTVDAVPVVRCKDCKHHHYDRSGIPYCSEGDYAYGWKDDDFCSYGERKDGDHHD